MTHLSQFCVRDPLSARIMPLPPCAASTDIEHCLTLAVSARMMHVTHRPTLARAPKPVRSPENRQPQGSEIHVSSHSTFGHSKSGQRPAH